MVWWVWLLLGLLLLLVELLTPGGFYMLFFGIGAVVIGLLTALEVAGPLSVQWLLFSVISVAALLLLRRPLLEKIRPADRAEDIDSLIGETALVLEEMPIREIGKVEMWGTPWSARNVGANTLARGQRCKVERVEGLMLWVRGD